LSGRLICRPSLKDAVIHRSVTSTVTILGYSGPAVLIPSCLDLREVLKYKTLDGKKLVGVESSSARKLERPQPELAEARFPPDMDVRPFVAIEAVEEEPVGSRDTGDGRHEPTVTLPRPRGDNSG
jgi:hypothetical protein